MNRNEVIEKIIANIINTENEQKFLDPECFMYQNNQDSLKFYRDCLTDLDRLEEIYKPIPVSHTNGYLETDKEILEKLIPYPHTRFKIDDKVKQKLEETRENKQRPILDKINSNYTGNLSKEDLDILSQAEVEYKNNLIEERKKAKEKHEELYQSLGGKL